MQSAPLQNPIIQVNPKRGINLNDTIPRQVLIGAYGACQWWLSKTWLNQPEPHPAQVLWRTGGWAADAELFFMGRAIQQLHRNGTSKKAFDEKRKEFLGTQLGNQAGYLFELLVSLLFLEGGNRTKLLPASAAGYDLDVSTPNGVKIQVSCKVSQPSTVYRQFVHTAEIVRDTFREALQGVGVQGGFCVLDFNSFPLNVFPNKNDFIQGLLGSVPHPMKIIWPFGQAVTGFLPKPKYALGFSKHYLSYTFLAGAKIIEDVELKRVLEQVGIANKKFKKYAQPGRLNLTVLRIPHYLSLDSVKRHLERQFQQRYTNTSAVLLIQTTIVKTNNGAGPINVLNAVQLVIHPNAIVPWQSQMTVPLELKTPMGTVGTTSPPIEISGQRIAADSYIFMDSIENTVVPLGTQMRGSEIPGVHTIAQWDTSDIIMEMPYVPTEFTLL